MRKHCGKVEAAQHLSDRREDQRQTRLPSSGQRRAGAATRLATSVFQMPSLTSSQIAAQAIDNALDAFVAIDASSTVLVWTKRAQDFFGWSPEEAIGSPLTELIIPERLRKAHDDGMKQYLQTREPSVIGRRLEIAAKHKSGHEFPVELSVTELEVEGRIVFSAALRDITASKLVEAQLRATFDQAAVGIAHISADGTLLRVNQKLCEILGRSQSELVGFPIRSFMHSDDVGLEEQHVDELFAGRATSTVHEQRFVRATGEDVWLKLTLSLLREVSGEYLISIAEDITEAKHTKKRAELLAAIIDASPDFVSFFTLEGELQYINRAGREMVGIPLEQDARDVPIDKKYPPWAFERFHEGIKMAVEAGTWRGETAVYSAAGEEIPTSQVIIALRDPDGGAKYLSSIIRDMSERHNAERALREADRRKDAFLAMLAHELRNPLAPITTAAQILSSRQLDPTRLAHASEIIRRQAAHMTELIDDLLDVSRLTRGLIHIDRSPVEFNSLLQDSIEQARNLIKIRRQDLVVQSSPEPAWVAGDRTRLVQVIANLLNNAAKYTAESGTIVVGVKVLVSHVCVFVRDNGSGISGELLPHVFELFVQANRTPDRAQGGLGLGLPLVKHVVELHGGSVTAQSEGEGKGSEFVVRFPRLPRPAVPEIPGGGALAVDSGGALNITIVDDNADAAHTLTMLLELHGHKVSSAHTAHDGLAQAEALRPRVLLLDIGLPDMDGYELARRVRALPGMADSMLIAVTGYGQAEDIEAALAAGFDFHMTKPVDTTRLISLLHSLGSC